MSASDPEPQQEYTFEPAKFSDLTLIYNQVRFRVHKCILARHSTYFSALLEGDLETKEVTLALVCSQGIQCSWNAQRMNNWLICVYREEPLCIDDFMKRESTPNTELRPTLYTLFDFTMYFGCGKLEKQIRSISSSLLEFPLVRRNVFLILHLLRLQAAKWKDLVDIYEKIIGENLDSIRKHHEYRDVVWNLLSPDTQERILKIASNKQQLLTNSVK